jgi:hypothetical protein
MTKLNRSTGCVASIVGFICCMSLVIASATPAIAADRPAPAFDESAGITLFAFDLVSIPFTENLKVEMRQPVKHPANPVLPRGKRGEPDSWAVQFYGSVIREQGKFRMWYVAAGDERIASKGPRSAPWRVAYAESDDGVKWNKPDLGLVEYGGSKTNNLVEMDIPPLGILNLKVLRDDDDADPSRRYKMSAHVWFPKGESRFGTLAVFASPDGLRWSSLTKVKPVKAELTENDLVLPPIHFEPCGGLYKWDGVFYISGQNALPAAQPYHGRVARAYQSADFVNWSHASSAAFVRTPQHTLLGPGRSREGEQTHEGISVWNRRNVLLGVYGIWHGAKEWSGVTIDLGFVMSNDGINFREPAHEWTFLERGEDGAWDQGGLLQGQGFENVGDQTYVYYGAWDPRNSQSAPPRGGVGIATLPRDRFGHLMVDEKNKGPGDYQLKEINCQLVTSPIPLKAGARRFYINAEGLGADATLRAELLDDHLKPLAGFSGDDAAVVSTSGFHTPIAWKGTNEVEGLPARVRLRITFPGKRNADIRLCAVYVQ